PGNIAEPVRDLMGGCLSKDPRDRPPSARAARVVLEDVMGVRRAAAFHHGETEDAPAHNLPRTPTSFIGRKRDIEACGRLLSETPLLTLVGPGGCGKTRLALRLAQDTLARHPDGTWFVDLSALTVPESLVATVASVVGVREETGSDLSATLLRHLA